MRLNAIGVVFCLSLLLPGCSGGGPATPAGPQPPAEAPRPVVVDPTSSAVPFGMWDLALDVTGERPEAAVTPLAQPIRSSQVIGDLFDLEVIDYFKATPCGDCFAVDGLDLDVDGNVLVDFRMRHPFRTTAARADLDVFDPRLIWITDQIATTYPAIDPVLGGRDGTTSTPVSLEPGLILNADGHTPHYDWIAEDPSIVGTARNDDGSINPYKDFFTESDPDPVIDGPRIVNRRMPMVSNWDTKRFVISKTALTAHGGSISALLLLEVSYGQSAQRTITNPNRGSRLNPVYYLPAFNRKEAIALKGLPSADFTNGIANELQTLSVSVSDWQAGKTGVGPASFAVAPDFQGQTQIPYTSNLDKVVFTAPSIDPTLRNVTTFPAGDGSLDIPYTFSIPVINALQPSPGTYYGLLAAQDTYHNAQSQPGFAYDSGQSVIRDFRMFKVVPLTVNPGSGNAIPTAHLKARKVGAPSWTVPPAVLNVTTADTVEFTLVDSTDPESLWSTPAAHFDLDGSAGTGPNGGFEVTSINIGDAPVTTTYSSAGTVTARGMVRDNLPQFSTPDSLTIQITLPPNNPPVAHIKGRKVGSSTWLVPPATITILAGETVEFTLADSTDDQGLWSNPAAYYDLDGNVGNGFEVTKTLITDLATVTIAAAGSRTIRGQVKDNLPQLSGIDSITVTASAGPTCYTTTNIADFPLQIYEHSADTVGNKIYIFAGYAPSFPGNHRPNIGWVYDIAGNNYTQLSGTFQGFQAGQGREGSDVIAIGTKLYIVGGTGTFVSSCVYTNPMSVYDTASGLYTNTLAVLNPSLWRCAAVAYNGRLWMPGGFREASGGCYTAQATNTVTIYNPTTDSWGSLNEFGVAVTPFTNRRWAHGVAVLNNKLYCLPGEYMNAAGFQGTVAGVEEYDLGVASPSWVNKDVAPGTQPRWLYEPEVVNNRAYIIGGLDASSNAQAQVWQFDPSKTAGTQWTTLTTACGGTPLPGVRYGYASAVYNNEIYIFAGATALSTYTVNSYKITLQ
ncbi:MAG: hypothetical protein ABI743_02815 [bacterium]